MLFIENKNTLTIVGTNKVINYALIKRHEEVNEQQYNLLEGQKITYPDGSVILHAGNYALLRHYVMKNGSVVDRVAIPWDMLVLAAN